MIRKPLFDIRSLGSRNHTVPFDLTGKLAVYAHHIGVFVEDLNAIVGNALASIGRGNILVVSHLLTV